MHVEHNLGVGSSLSLAEHRTPGNLAKTATMTMSMKRPVMQLWTIRAYGVTHNHVSAEPEVKQSGPEQKTARLMSSAKASATTFHLH